MCIAPIGQRQRKDKTETVAAQGPVILETLALSTGFISIKSLLTLEHI